MSADDDLIDAFRFIPALIGILIGCAISAWVVWP